MLGVPVDSLIETFGYIAIFVLMIFNGFLSFPSSQILYIVAGYFVFTGSLSFVVAAAVGALGNTIGNYVLFDLSRRKGLEYTARFTKIPQREISKLQLVFKKYGAWFLAIGKLLPAIKVFMPIVAGIGAMRVSLFLPIILITSFIWACMFLSIGYFFGKQAEVFGVYSVLLLIIAFVVVGAFYKLMNSKKILAELDEQ